ncbi:MAG TPA: hypothetical protein VIO81_13500 [Methyloversatilis sp.]
MRQFPPSPDEPVVYCAMQMLLIDSQQGEMRDFTGSAGDGFLDYAAVGRNTHHGCGLRPASLETFMTIKIYDNHFENCGTGISAPSDASVDIGANRFVACGKAIDLRAPESLLDALGLRPDTPLEVLKEVFSFIGAGQRTEPEIMEKAKSTGLFQWLSAGADAVALVQGLTALCPYVPQILATLSC